MGLSIDLCTFGVHQFISHQVANSGTFSLRLTKEMLTVAGARDGELTSAL
jgi:hypothetical protein